MTRESEDLDLVLGGYGQMLVTIFTQIGLCYALPDESRIPAIIERLQKGLELLGDRFPWLAGQVVCEGAGEGVTGVFKVKPLDAAPRLHVKDLTSNGITPSLEELRHAGYPMNALDEDLVAPRKTSSGRPGETTAEVFQLQLSIIKGGIILTFLGQHQCMDGVGQGEVMRLLSKACRGEPFTDDELRTGNRCGPEDETIPLLDDKEDVWVPGLELKYNRVDPSLLAARASRPMGLRLAGEWCHFSFSAESLRSLKEVATQTLPVDTTPYISTDDALSAFVWQAIMRARLPRLGDSSKALFARSVDVRRFLGISATHPGFAQCMTYHDSFTALQLVQSPLGVVAADLRAAVASETSTLAYDARSLATLVSRTPDKSLVSLLGGDFDMTRDVMLNSWANQDAYQLDFGLGLGLGCPEAVRRPRFDGAFPGLVYLLPRRRDGEIGVAVCLSGDDMARLKSDWEFARVAVAIG